MSSNSNSNSGSSCSYATCFCGEVAPTRVSWTTRNPGRRFLGCKIFGNNGCNFFDWVDKEKSMDEEMQDIRNKMRAIHRQKEDWRAVAEGVKELNAHLSERVESERKNREELQRKYEQCNKALKCARSRVYLLMLLLALSVICNLFY
ncbi:hypothetical protein LguiA_007572 [Lonicera macranthoides]